jgi:hypothetical protein
VNYFTSLVKGINDSRKIGIEFPLRQIDISKVEDVLGPLYEQNERMLAVNLNRENSTKVASYFLQKKIDRKLLGDLKIKGRDAISRYGKVGKFLLKFDKKLSKTNDPLERAPFEWANLQLYCDAYSKWMFPYDNTFEYFPLKTEFRNFSPAVSWSLKLLDYLTGFSGKPKSMGILNTLTTVKSVATKKYEQLLEVKDALQESGISKDDFKKLSTEKKISVVKNTPEAYRKLKQVTNCYPIYETRDTKTAVEYISSDLFDWGVQKDSVKSRNKNAVEKRDKALEEVKKYFEKEKTKLEDITTLVDLLRERNKQEELWPVYGHKGLEVLAVKDRYASDLVSAMPEYLQTKLEKRTKELLQTKEANYSYWIVAEAIQKDYECMPEFFKTRYEALFDRIKKGENNGRV